MSGFFQFNAIPPLAWEVEAERATGLSPSMIRFGVSFVLYLFLNAVLRYVPGRTGRLWFSLTSGILLVYYPFGNGVFHSVAPIAATYLSVRLFPAYAGTLTWLTAFPMLVANHVLSASGLAWKSGAVDFLGAQMVLTLRLISSAAAVADGQRLAAGRALPAGQRARSLSAPPGLLEFLAYCFASGNLLAGPHYEIKEFLDYVSRTGDWGPDKAAVAVSTGAAAAASRAHAHLPPPTSLAGGLPPAWLPGLARTLKAGACLAIWLALSARGVTADLYSSPTWLSASQPRRVALFWAVGFAFRTKYYFAWAVGEAGLILSGQDFTPPRWQLDVHEPVDPDARAKGAKVGPVHDGEAEETTVARGGGEGKPAVATTETLSSHATSHPVSPARFGERFPNTRILAVEFQPSFSGLTANWNVQTGTWLRHYVYERLVRPGNKPGLQTLVATQVASGVWHGLFPGYWGFFVTSAFAIQASKVVHRYEKGWARPEGGTRAKEAGRAPARVDGRAEVSATPWARRALRAVAGRLWWALKCLYTSLVLNYTAIAFELLTWEDSFKAWRDVYFIGHLAVLAVILVGAVLPPSGAQGRRAHRTRRGAAAITVPPAEAKKEL